MRHTSTPRHVREADARTVDSSPDTAAVRAEDVLPSGYRAQQIAKPPATELTEAADSLGALALCADLIRMPAADPEHSQRVAALISLESRRLAGVLRSLAAGAAVVALLAVGLVVAPLGGTPRASAAVLPQAMPASAGYRVVLDRSSTTIRVAATSYTTNAAGLHCARVQLVAPGLSVGFSILARGCSWSPWFTVTVPVTAARFGGGGAYRLAVVDDQTDTTTGTAALTVLRPSRIAGSYIADGLGGQLFAAVALEHYQAASRTWLPSKLSPVQVQILVGRTWRTVGTLTTDANGYAGGYVWTGPGRFVVRLVRPGGATVTGVTGAAWRVTVTATAADVM